TQHWGRLEVTPTAAIAFAEFCAHPRRSGANGTSSSNAAPSFAPTNPKSRGLFLPCVFGSGAARGRMLLPCVFGLGARARMLLIGSRPVSCGPVDGPTALCMLGSYYSPT